MRVPLVHRVHLRSELCALVDRIHELPLIVVAAPAGSGKTTLLSDWREALEASGRTAAWIDLAPLHADPGSFLEELAAEMEWRALPRSHQVRGSP